MDRFPPQVADWLSSTGQGSLLSADPVGGGCIHQARILRTSSGASFFLKSSPSVPPDMFSSEAQGLRALHVPGGPTIPQVFLVGETFLLLEDLRPAARRKDFWEIYGRQLAQIHLQHHPRFGFPNDNYIGSKVQHNSWLEDGFAFFRERRLAPQIRWAVDSGYLDREDQARCSALLDRLEDLLPGGPAVLIHGDLWSGNLISDSRGGPALIDPAAHYGWAEADLAMAELFGSYPQEFYQAYLQANPLPAGFRERFPIYNLYHLLNHLNIFGSGYLTGVRELLRRFS